MKAALNPIVLVLAITATYTLAQDNNLDEPPSLTPANVDTPQTEPASPPLPSPQILRPAPPVGPPQEPGSEEELRQTIAGLRKDVRQLRMEREELFQQLAKATKQLDQTQRESTPPDPFNPPLQDASVQITQVGQYQIAGAGDRIYMVNTRDGTLYYSPSSTDNPGWQKLHGPHNEAAATESTTDGTSGGTEQEATTADEKQIANLREARRRISEAQAAILYAISFTRNAEIHRQGEEALRELDELHRLMTTEYRRLRTGG